MADDEMGDEGEQEFVPRDVVPQEGLPSPEVVDLLVANKGEQVQVHWPHLTEEGVEVETFGATLAVDRTLLDPADDNNDEEHDDDDD